MEARLTSMEKEVGAISAMLRERMSKEDVITQTIQETIKVVVNGKIDRIHTMLEKQNESTSAFHDKVDAHIARVEPVIRAYEEDQILKEGASKLGKRTIFWSQVVGACAALIFIIREILKP